VLNAPLGCGAGWQNDYCGKTIRASLRVFFVAFYLTFADRGLKIHATNTE